MSRQELIARPVPPRVFLVLLEGAHGRVTADSLSMLAAAGTIRTLIPPLTGAAFLQDASQGGAVVDSWWERARAGPHRPVVLVAHEETLPRTASGFDADFVVAVPDAGIEDLYTGLPNVRAVVTDDPTRLAQLALQEHVALASSPAEPPDPFGLLADAGDLAPHAQPGTPLRRRSARLRAARRVAPQV